MKIVLGKFGRLLISRPAGREAALIAASGFKPPTPQEPFELDFSGVEVLAPSWMDEFVQGLKAQFPNPIHCLPSDNLSVVESLKFVSFS